MPCARGYALRPGLCLAPQPPSSPAGRRGMRWGLKGGTVQVGAAHGDEGPARQATDDRPAIGELHAPGVERHRSGAPRARFGLDLAAMAAAPFRKAGAVGNGRRRRLPDAVGVGVELRWLPVDHRDLCQPEGQDDGPVSPLAPRPVTGDRLPSALRRRHRAGYISRVWCCSAFDRRIAPALQALKECWPSVVRRVLLGR
jgi:hypothetical protein